LFEARLHATNIKTLSRDQAIVTVVASFATKAPSPPLEPRAQKPMASAGADISTGDPPTIKPPAPSVREHPNWDVYRSGLGTSAFVYER
jgi:type IV secretion system protein VirB1